MSTTQSAPPLQTSLLAHAERAMQAAVRTLPTVRARTVLWQAWRQWREDAPVLLPPDHMPWHDLPDPASGAALVDTTVLSDAVQNMFRVLIRDGYATPDDLAPAIAAFPAAMDDLEHRQPPAAIDGSGLPRCRQCGTRCTTTRQVYCGSTCRQRAHRERQERAEQKRQRERDRYAARNAPEGGPD